MLKFMIKSFNRWNHAKLESGEIASWFATAGAVALISLSTVLSIEFLSVGLEQRARADDFNNWRSDVVSGQRTSCLFQSIVNTRPCDYRCGTEMCTATQHYYIGYANERCGVDTPLGWWSEGCPSSEKELGTTFECFIKDCEDEAISMKPLVSGKSHEGKTYIAIGIACGCIGFVSLVTLVAKIILCCIKSHRRKELQKASVGPSKVVEMV